MNPAPQSATVPQKQCNLVMKGVIASGVVYPPAINELKEHYQFRRIGGTSSGAIAAAVAAAAEYCRQQGGGELGFNKLNDLSRELTQSGALRSLFQPSPETKPLFETLLTLFSATQQGSNVGEQRQSQEPLLPVLQLLRRVWPTLPDNVLQLANTLLRQWTQENVAFLQGKRWGIWVGGMLGALFGLLLALIGSVLVALFAPSPLLILVVLGVCWLIFGSGFAWLGAGLGGELGGAGSVLIDLYDILAHKLKDNFFGMCRGHDEQSTSSNLMDWLHLRLQEIAGLSTAPDAVPLTFAALKEQWNEGKGIDLHVVTSNLSHARPYVLPDDLGNFIFRQAEWQHFFPAPILSHLVKHGSPTRQITRAGSTQPITITLPDGYLFFPEQKNPELLPEIPVLVAVRLSISFPLLISAVPLYTIDQQALAGAHTALVLTQENLQKNWFSDGGICSNFPIEFFDEWLPTIPTFGINLTTLALLPVDPNQRSLLPAAPANQLAQQETGQPQQETPQHQQQQTAAARGDPLVYLPRADDPQAPQWAEQDTLLSFVLALLGTGLYHRELIQASLPSYRERIVQIGLRPDEDGLHLDMSRDTIQALQQKGQDAGALLTAQDKEGFNFEHHQWVRLQVLMALLEHNLRDATDAYASPAYQELLKREPDQQNEFPYPHDQQWCALLSDRLNGLVSLSHQWRLRPRRVTVLDDPGILVVHPSPVLQVVSQF